jgi:hypothetical protein
MAGVTVTGPRFIHRNLSTTKKVLGCHLEHASSARRGGIEHPAPRIICVRHCSICASMTHRLPGVPHEKLVQRQRVSNWTDP